MLSRIKNINRIRRQLSHTSYTPPDITDVVTKWRTLHPSLREEITEYLNWKMEDNWKNMPRNEIKAIYYISFGVYGPRSKVEDVSPVYLIWKGLFSGILFTAIGVSILNLQKDKKVNSELKNLQKHCIN